jgi:hypothetical protein
MSVQALTCYKYRSGAAAVRCLSEGTAYFASPAELNDSLEAKFDLAGAKDFARVYNATLTELAKLRGSKMSFLRPVPKGLPAVTRTENKRFREASQRVGIFSAAPRPDNQPMWAYYCNNFQGVCFQLEWPSEVLGTYHLYPTKVTYTDKARVHNRADDYREILLELSRENPTWNMAQLGAFALTDTFLRKVGIRSMGRAVSMKHLDWAHEGELRIVASKPGPIPVMRNILKRVIFGRTDFEEWGSIMMLLHRLYPETNLAQISFHHKEPFVHIQPMEFRKVPISYT